MRVLSLQYCKFLLSLAAIAAAMGELDVSAYGPHDADQSAGLPKTGMEDFTPAVPGVNLPPPFSTAWLPNSPPSASGWVFAGSGAEEDSKDEELPSLPSSLRWLTNPAMACAMALVLLLQVTGIVIWMVYKKFCVCHGGRDSDPPPV